MAAAVAAAASLLVLVGCAWESTDTQAAGIVISVDSPALGRVDSFQLLTSDGQKLTFDTSELECDPEFPVSHLSEHQLLSDPVEVTYREDGGRLMVTKLDDGG